jgi:hypothetical protein
MYRSANRPTPRSARALCALVLIAAACGGGEADDDDAPVCGNAVVDAGEQCDGVDLGGENCMTVTQQGGTLRCNADCTFDTSACTLASCGNGVREDGESCDGTDLGGATCETVGYSGGAMGCRMDCTYEVATCCTDTCPDDGATMCVGDNLRSCAPAASGCLAWELSDCAATGDVCDASGGPAACVCIDRCGAVGDTRCEGAAIETCALQPDGCLGWDQTEDCSAAGEICAVAAGVPGCVPDASAEDCSDPYPLTGGDNIVAWTAIDADYMVGQPSCNTTSLAGPDLVMAYTAPEDGFVSVTMHKPASMRQVIVVSDAACGTLEPELACLSDFTPTTLDVEFGVSAGSTYYVYVRDTTSGTAPLDNPLLVTVTEALCSTIGLGVTNLSPANGTSVPDVTPILTADFDYPASASAGVITVTGDLGTNLSYDLATGPIEVALTNGGRTLVIDPGIVLPAGETLTVSWTGLVDATCGNPIVAPVWSFEVAGPPCAPGQDGMVGTTVTRIPTGISSISEQYVAADTDPNGYVYVGGLTSLFRIAKVGGATQDVVGTTTVTSTQLGYDMLVVGNELFTIDSNTTATSNQLWRISTDGGMTFANQNYLQLTQPPGDDFRGLAYYEGRIYLMTDEGTSTAATEIWSVPAASSTLPEIAVLEGTLPGYTNCHGIALDDFYYYLACYDAAADQVIRLDRTTFALEIITDGTIDHSSVKNMLHAHDLDGDGRADVLYHQSQFEQVHYICAPGGAAPFLSSVLVDYGGASSNYGLGFDPVAGVLWAYDDDTQELVKIE